MAHPEFTHRPKLKGFQHEITYARPDLAPHAVAPATNLYIRKYAAGQVSDSHGVLKGSVDFIRNARIGLANNPEIVDRIHVASWEDVENIKKDHENSSTPPDETIEATRFTLAAMGVMGQEAMVKTMDDEGNVIAIKFAEHGIMSAPFTLREATARMNEVARQTLRVDANKAPRAMYLYEDVPAWRNRLFWELAAKIAEEVWKPTQLRLI